MGRWDRHVKAQSRSATSMEEWRQTQAAKKQKTQTRKAVSKTKQHSKALSPNSKAAKAEQLRRQLEALGQPVPPPQQPS